jgi:putative beta barrel porin BBP7
MVQSEKGRDMNGWILRTLSIGGALLGAVGSALAADLAVKAPAAVPAANLFWADVDLLAWTVKGDRLPPLVTTSPVGTPFAQTGVLGLPTTSVLFGDSSVNGAWRAGGRLRAGYWFDPSRSRGIEASVFGLGDVSTGFNANSATTPIIARPFFNAFLNVQDASIVALPGLTSGNIAINETSRFYGAGALYRQDIGTWANMRVSALVGYRYLHSSDNLAIASQTTILPGNLFAGTVFGVTDSFRASSDFHGVDLGLAGQWQNERWTLEWRGKVALGGNISNANISGATAITLAGVTTNFAGGLLALSSNIGSFSQTRFAVVPEFSLKAGYQLAPQWRLFAGYDVLYWTDVQRAGGLIDVAVNPNLVPPAGAGGPQRPAPVFNTSPLLAQGFSFGARYNY